MRGAIRVSGRHTAYLNNPKALKKLDKIKDNLRKHGLTVQENEHWLQGGSGTSLVRTITFEGVSKPLRTVRPKPNPLYDPWVGPPADWDWTDEDLAFLAETAQLKPIG